MDYLEGEIDYHIGIMKILRRVTQEDSHCLYVGQQFPGIAATVARRANHYSMETEAQEDSIAFVRNYLRFGVLANNVDADLVDSIIAIGVQFNSIKKSDPKAEQIKAHINQCIAHLTKIPHL